jgi:FlaA1/EpsC-like NDP-sugar epimerase/lipopolysaccharide/colanic/teichoic acid biosynthesis glycosyltransferase
VTEHTQSAPSSRHMSMWQAAVKRGMDLVLGTLATVLLLPVGLLVALAVVIDSAGPAIYGARRVGRNGREFTMWKFRSMARGAERVGPGVTGAYDFRVTRVGAFLRRSKLDEIPQLLNVVAGQMSLVGPRPEAPTYVKRWRPEEREVLSVRPGITGPTQVAYIAEEELLVGDPDVTYESELMHAKLAIDLDYVRRHSLRRDVAILWRTLLGVLNPGERHANRPRRRYTLGERLQSARSGPLLLDAALAALGASLAVGLRIDRNNIFAAVATYWVLVPLAAVVRPLGFLLAGAYLRVWRYPTVSDAALVVSSLLAGSLVMTLAIFVVLQPWAFPGTVGFPRSAIIIEFVLSFLLLGGIRFASRVREQGFEEGVAEPMVAGPPKPVLIYGAGEAGALLVREMRRNRMLRLEPVAFLDDDPARRGQRIYGVEVVGGAEALPGVVAERDVSEVIVAMPRVAGSELRRLVTLCEASGVAVRTLPGVEELLDDSVTINKVRPVRVEDLLRRSPTDVPEEPMRELVGDRTVLVTGAGGSIGSELCRQVAALGARRLILVERAETPLFYVEQELRRRFPGLELVPLQADVTDEQAVRRIMDRERPAVVLHAAANKHVPLSESNVAQTVLTNVRGTRLLAEIAEEVGLEAFIFISTDKAVDPSSVMGATKRLGERLTQEIGARAAGRWVIVRFGNVLGSQGSVLEVFRQQIADGGPVTVTHPDMTRYFMTIPEAVRLILFAGAVGRSGDIHVLNMGQPIRITDLARDLIRLSVPAGHKDISVVFSGLRPGEKMEEVLFAPDEQPVPTEHEYLLVARPGNGGGTKAAGISGASARQWAVLLEDLAVSGDDHRLRDALEGHDAAAATAQEETARQRASRGT